MGIEKNADKVEMARITNASVKHLNVMICDDEKEHVLHLQQLLEQLQDEAMRRNLIKRKMLFCCIHNHGRIDDVRVYKVRKCPKYRK